MTRNNLSGHLTWLLKNVALSRPTAHEFPNTSDTSSFRFSQSQSTDAPTTNLSQATTASTGVDRRIPQVQESRSSNGPPKREEVLQDTKVVVLEDDSMGRLSLSTKPKKSSLLLQNGQLATPSTADSQIKQRLDESLKSSGA
jgi:bloom syndrome protein